MHPKLRERPSKSQSTVKSLGKGYMRAIILALLAEQPRYGYELLHTLADSSDGWRPSPGTIYPILHDLHERGWITKKESEQEGRRRIIYRIRAKGKHHLEHDAMEHARFVAMMRKILIKHGGPHFPRAPAFNVDKALHRLQHLNLILDEAPLLPQDIASDPSESLVLLKRRLRLLERHQVNIKKAIQNVKKEIQNREEMPSHNKSELEK
ncbi:MAG: PadR family transcriptional regulator [Promethearchaeota archaeon]